MLVRVMKFGLPALFAVLLLATAPAKAATVVVPGFLDQPVVANSSYVGTTSATGNAGGAFDQHWLVAIAGPMDTVTTVTQAFPPFGGSFTAIKFEWLDSLANPISPLANGLGTDLVFAFTAGGNYILHVFGSALLAASYTATLTTTPLPAALILFGSGLLGLSLLGRRRRAAVDSSL